MATPSSHSPMFGHDLGRHLSRPSFDYSRPRSENKPVALPSIRQTFPDLHLDGSLADASSSHSHSQRPPSGAGRPPLASPEYIHSPDFNKRRRISSEDDQFTYRARQVPRLYRSPEISLSRQLTPPRREAPAAESWASPTRPLFMPAPVEMNTSLESRPSLPSLPSAVSRPREAVSMERPPAPTYQSQDYGYSYHHPTRYQSLSASAIRPLDRASFSSTGGGYGPPYHDMSRCGDLGGMGLGVDGKQRKRRGNLPKETTDKLRSWFVAHLQHPYPTEDEKQELMRQTGLQMNQISNWFINARRRQLPAMINSARAEADVISGRIGSAGAGADNKILASTERAADYHTGPVKRHDTYNLPLSDGESGGYDEDMGSSGLRKRRAGDLHRESI
ncbi:hypothetical protein CDD82_744 [Ophiocordyceps australis]|uniref:Homeobox domain-containing protein n=1 Tax=Ophiocordyceps australis TaxID=1399860 RepID=A0A2C5XQK4_9HYPO|nr:hypothetical protein CDD82_744 [Ophiocordyceps australis]